MRYASLLVVGGTLHLAMENAMATSFVVPSGQTVLMQQTLGPADGETGIIEAGGSLGNGTGATPSPLIIVSGPNAAITNFGQLRASNQALTTSGSNIGTITIFNAAGATFSGPVDPSEGNVFVENHGLITSPVGFTLLDFRSVSGTTFINHPDGTLMHGFGEPMRLGANATVINHGLISGTSVGITTTSALNQSITNSGTIIGTTDGARGVRINNGTISNSGTIIGGLDGARGDSRFGHLVLSNEIGGLIRGRTDSGVSAKGTANIVNRGTIAAGTAGVAGDDGIDVDSDATIDNFGTITAVGSQDPPTGANTNEGVTMGGGSLHNFAGAIILSQQNGVYFAISADNDPNQSSAGVLNNAGSIIADTGFGVRFFGNATQSFNNTLINSGTIQGALTAIRMSSGIDQLTNSGTIVTSAATAIDMGAGDDHVTITDGLVQGDIDGGSGSNRITFDLVPAQTFTHSHALLNFGEIEVRRGRVMLEDNFTLVTNTLNLVEQGTLDLTANALVVEYSGSTPLTSIQTAIASAYNNGAWDGSGLTSSQADASNFALGYAESDDVFASFPATFAGVLVDDTAVLVRLARYGDANLDGLVNLEDFNRLAANFGSSAALWSGGDFNYDQIVNLDDFNKLAANFGMTVSANGPTPQDWAALANVVPEPDGIVWLLPGAVALPRRRIRRSCAIGRRSQSVRSSPSH